MVTLLPSAKYVKGSPKANEGTKAMQRRKRMISRISFIMYLKDEFYQSPGEVARCVLSRFFKQTRWIETTSDKSSGTGCGRWCLNTMKGLKRLKNCAQRGDGLFAMTPQLIVSWIFAIIMFILMIVAMSFGATWLRAYFSGARVTFLELISLSIKSIPVKIIVETWMTLIKSGFNVSVDNLSTH